MATPPVPILTVDFDGYVEVFTLCEKYPPIAWLDSKQVDHVPPPVPVYAVSAGLYDTYDVCGEDEDEELKGKDDVEHYYDGYISELSVSTSPAVVPIIVCQFNTHAKDRKRVHRVEREIMISVHCTQLQGTLLQRFYGMWASARTQGTEYVALFEPIHTTVEDVIFGSGLKQSVLSRWHAAITKAYYRLHSHGLMCNDYDLRNIGLRGAPDRGIFGKYNDVGPETADICFLSLDHAMESSHPRFQDALIHERKEVKRLEEKLREYSDPAWLL